MFRVWVWWLLELDFVNNDVIFWLEALAAISLCIFPETWRLQSFAPPCPMEKSELHTEQYTNSGPCFLDSERQGQVRVYSLRNTCFFAFFRCGIVVFEPSSSVSCNRLEDFSAIYKIAGKKSVETRALKLRDRLTMAERIFRLWLARRVGPQHHIDQSQVPNHRWFRLSQGKLLCGLGKV